MNNKELKQTKSHKISDVSGKYLKKQDIRVDREELSYVSFPINQTRNDLGFMHRIKKNKKRLAIVGHDIRSSIGLVTGYLGLAKKSINTLDETVIKKNIDLALLTAEKKETLRDGVLKEKLAEKVVTAGPQEFIDISVLINEEIDKIKDFANQKQIRLTAHNIPHLKVFVDVNMIRIVFHNLLNNAIKYTFIKGDIEIQAIQQDKLIEITVKDNGIGIKEDRKNKIFELKNIQNDLGSKNKLRTGSGLLICKEIIDLHKGQLWVASAKGIGSELKFTLPLS